MQVDSNVSNWIQNQSKLFPNFTSYFQKFDKLYDQKYAQINDRLWHELTIELEELTVKVEANSLLLSLYDNFIKHFETKINKISLVRLVSRICKQKNPKDAIEFLTLTAAQLKKDENHQNAFVLISAEIASLKLSTGQLEGCLSEIKDCEKILEKLPYPDPVINASFYKVCCEYYKATNGYQQFYHNALLYLSSVSIEELSKDEKHQRAFDLCMSALLAKGLYNFGELLMHPILNSLTNTKNQWLGDLNGFDSISKSAEFMSQESLRTNIPSLREKLCLMTLMEAVFKRTKEERSKMSFSEISAETRVTIDEVEHLVMKALSLGLIKGSIDEVDSVVTVSWVQPRVLSKIQIKHIADRIKEWGEKVNGKVNGLQAEEAFQTVFAQ